ncbi:MAG: hypothetical protein U0936_09640 [Planctomycetaceae bacterium]
MTAGLVFPFPMSGRHWNAVFNIAHAPSFLLLFLVIAGILDPKSIGFPPAAMTLLTLSLRRLAILSGTLFLVGVAGELAQKFVDRHPSVEDIVANCAGLLAGMFYCLSLKVSERRYRLGMKALSLVSIAYPCAVPLQELLECLRQRSEFPLLASFERTAELTAWAPHGATLTCDTSWSSHGSKSMRLESNRERDPGAVMIWPVANWNDYSTLQFDLYNPESRSIVVGVTISDAHHALRLWEPSDRFNMNFEMKALEVRTVTIKLREVERSPVSRKMDMMHVSNLNIFTQSPPLGSKLFVDRIQLLK